MERILIVEDDQRLAEHLSSLFRSAGMFAMQICNVAELDHLLEEKQVFDAAILDRLLDGIDTKQKVSQLKRKWPNMPILILSAINTPLERAELLNLGVDDYLGKPFLSQELLARLRALLRRYLAEPTAYRQIGDLVLDIPRRILLRGEAQENLPTKEFMVLKVLSDNLGQVLNRSELLDFVWSGGIDVETNVVEVTIANLRKRIANLKSEVSLKNSRNVGYWLES